MARAVLESTAFQSKEIFDAMEKDSGINLAALKVDGGMVKNELLMQFQSDILGIEVIRPESSKQPCWRRVRGGTRGWILAGRDELVDNWSVDKTWKPKMDENGKNALLETGSGRWKEHTAAGALEDVPYMKRHETSVVIIGAEPREPASCGDCSLRGIPAILVEKNDLASGTTGRTTVCCIQAPGTRSETRNRAFECITENTILRDIAHHCIEDAGGLFITLPDDDPAYHDKLLEGCARAGIKCMEIDGAEARRIEPKRQPAVIKAVKVPDGTIDPFRAGGGERAGRQGTRRRPLHTLRSHGISETRRSSFRRILLRQD